METDEYSVRTIVAPGIQNPLVAVPVGIVFKSSIFYRGILRASVIETEMQISKMDERGITLDDGAWVPYSNISSISPLREPSGAGA